MSDRGFTMVELIVTIAIMAIILMITFPSVDKLQRTNKYKKMVSYGQAMVSGAKLYVEQYQEDLWGSMSTTGEKRIGMTDLQNATLLKNYTDKKDSCSFGEVRVNRTGTQNHFTYTYTYSLTCKISNKTVVCTGDDHTSECVEGGRKVYS